MMCDYLLKLIEYLCNPWLITPVVALIIYKYSLHWRVRYYRSNTRLDGKTALITGGNSGLGLEIAKDLARRGAKVIIAARDVAKGKREKEKIPLSEGQENLVVKHLDLSDLDSVRKLCKHVLANERRLDILVNNAGMIAENKVYTSDNLERIMATNYFGHFLLTNLLLDLLKQSGNARVIQTSSLMYKVGSINIDDLNYKNSYYRGEFAYARSKLAQLLFATELSKKLHNTGVTINSFDPGVVKTDIARDLTSKYSLANSLLMALFSIGVAEGAQTGIYLAVDEEVVGVSGKYFYNLREQSLQKQAQDPEKAKKLWEVSEKLVGLPTY